MVSAGASRNAELQARLAEYETEQVAAGDLKATAQYRAETLQLDQATLQTLKLLERHRREPIVLPAVRSCTSETPKTQSDVSACLSSRSHLCGLLAPQRHYRGNNHRGYDDEPETPANEAF